MPVPRRRHCPARQGKRRSHLRVRTHNLVVCENCGEKKLPHRICPHCGTFKREAFRARVTQA